MHGHSGMEGGSYDLLQDFIDYTQFLYSYHTIFKNGFDKNTNFAYQYLLNKELQF